MVHGYIDGSLRGNNHLKTKRQSTLIERIIIKAQTVCDQRSIVYNEVANAPRSFHDTRVLRVSILYDLYEYAKKPSVTNIV